MSGLFWLSDAQMSKLAPIFPEFPRQASGGRQVVRANVC